METLTNYIPSFSGVSSFMPSIDLVIYSFFAVIGGILLFFLFQLSKHRIYVEIYEQVKEGTVATGGRYMRVFDKETKMYYLRPLARGNRLPDFDNENYQKVDGVPFFGIRRQIKLIKINNWSYYTVSPDHNTNDTCIAKYKDSISWVLSELIRDFKQKINTGRLYQIIIILTPIITIIVLFLFLFLAIWTDLNIIDLFSKKLEILTEMLKK